MFALHALIVLGAVADYTSGTVIRRVKLTEDLPTALLNRNADGRCPRAPVVFEILQYFTATQFCSSYLALTTKTISTTVPSLAQTTTTTTTVQTDLFSATTTTTIPTTTTTTTTTTKTAPASTSTDSELTVTTVPTTAVTVTTTTTTTTSTTYEVDVENKKRGLAATAKRDVGADAKRNVVLRELSSRAAKRLSVACKCYVTAPTITVTSTDVSTGVSVSTSTLLSTSTTVVETDTAATTSTSVLTTIETTTPITVITSFSTSTTLKTVATTISTTTATDRKVDFIDIFAIPIELDGCTVQSYNQKLSNIGNSLNSSIDKCAPLCAMAGSSTCDDIFVQQNLPSGTWDCFLLSQAQEVNTNFQCNNPAIGQAAEVIIIY